ncbi:MAG: FtsQ-type POTRA domain-containing protein [Clostridia bacterium]|nr:FtsQ-type POTRA domain-containing protein [Clostridia bacterium]
MAGRKKKKVRINPKFLLTVLILVLSAVILFVTPLFDIRNIEISGNERIAKAEIQIASGIRKNKNIFAINKARAVKDIKAVGYIEDVKIARRLPGTVVIKVQEATVAAFLDYGGMHVGINNEGQALCRISKAFPATGAPIVKGIAAIKAEVGQKVKLRNGHADEYEVLEKLMETFEKYGMTQSITEVDVTKKDDIMFRYNGKLKIELGGLNDYDLKFNYIEAMLSELGPDATGVINMQAENYTYRNTIE